MLRLFYNRNRTFHKLSFGGLFEAVFITLFEGTLGLK